MSWGKKKKDEQRESSTVALRPEEKAEQMCQERLRIVFEEKENIFDENLHLNVSTIPVDKSLVPYNSVADLAALPNLKVIQPAEYVKKWASLFLGRHWNNGGLKDLAHDALEGLTYSFEADLPAQVELQSGCLLRAIVRDSLEGVGFKPYEVRFQKKFHSHPSGHWNRLNKTRTELIEQQREQYYFFYIMTGPEAEPQRLRLLSVSDSDLRISGKAFRALKLVKQLPEGVVQDVWIAELLGPDGRVNGESDPLLIVQITGYSYALCEWAE